MNRWMLNNIVLSLLDDYSVVDLSNMGPLPRRTMIQNATITALFTNISKVTSLNFIMVIIHFIFLGNKR